MKPLIRRAAQLKIPVVCVATDAPGTERLTAISADSYTNGAMAGELLSRFCEKGGPAAVVTGFLETVDHAEKLRGFRGCHGAARLVEVVAAHDDAREAYQKARELLENHPDLTAIYVNTSNSIPVLRAVEKTGRAGSLAVVTTDIFPELLPLLRSGTVWATMYQRPLSQGRARLRLPLSLPGGGQMPRRPHQAAAARGDAEQPGPDPGAAPHGIRGSFRP